MTSPAGIPPRAGVGLKAQHYDDVLTGRPDLGWFEVHAENYMGAGGPAHHYLTAVRRDWPLSLHGVGLSIGGAGPLDADHLARLKALVDRYQPGLVSEHLAWSSHGGDFLNDLLPLPYTRETLACVTAHVDQMQSGLGRRILLENPSTYVAFEHSEMDEIAFLTEVAKVTGCGLLLDVNNVYVSATNHGFDAREFVDALPPGCVGEMHLAGHSVLERDGHRLLVDTHSTHVCAEVWSLYEHALARFGATPTLIEWDLDLPPLDALLAEAAEADRRLRAAHALAA